MDEDELMEFEYAVDRIDRREQILTRGPEILRDATEEGMTLEEAFVELAREIG